MHKRRLTLSLFDIEAMRFGYFPLNIGPARPLSLDTLCSAPYTKVPFAKKEHTIEDSQDRISQNFLKQADIC